MDEEEIMNKKLEKLCKEQMPHTYEEWVRFAYIETVKIIEDKLKYIMREARGTGIVGLEEIGNAKDILEPGQVFEVIFKDLLRRYADINNNLLLRFTEFQEDNRYEGSNERFVA